MFELSFNGSSQTMGYTRRVKGLNEIGPDNGEDTLGSSLISA
jgi:hypothetical protein